MKWIVRIGLAAIVLLVVAVVIVALSLNSLARRGIEQGAGFAMGVPTTLDDANVSLLGGSFTMAGLHVANPPGFTTPRFLTVGGADLGLTLGSLFQDTIELPRMAFTDIEINLEKEAGKENYRVILENLQKLSSGEKQPQQEPQQPGKKFVIRELTITGITANLKGYPGPAVVKVAPIKLTDVGTGGKPVDAAYLTGLVMRSIFQSLLASGLPADLLAGLGPDLDKLQGLGEVGVLLGDKAISEVTGKLDEAKKELEQKVNQEITQGIGNLLGGDKKKDEKPAAPTP